MSQLAMPLVMVNLGGEMIYILDQRLKAQNIPTDKGNKVLCDVLTTMFDKKYVDKLFTPQDIYDARTTRKIFDRLAHSSIMRLSENSMDKLFDLMMMGFKYQLMCSTTLDEMLKVTRLHLSTVRGMLSSFATAAVLELITNVEAQLERLYAGFTLGQQHQLRMTLLRFFQDRRVKVSLFLKEGIQTPAGRIVLPTPVTSVVGTVRYMVPAKSESKVALKALETDKNEFFQHPVPLGANLYNKGRPEVVPPKRRTDLPAGAKVEDKPTYAADDVAGHSNARKELDLLQALLAVKAPPSDNFKLDLFGDLDSGKGGSGSAAGVQTLNFGTGGKNDTYAAKNLSGVMKDMSMADKGNKNDDLLDLLDKA